MEKKQYNRAFETKVENQDAHLSNAQVIVPLNYLIKVQDKLDQLTIDMRALSVRAVGVYKEDIATREKDITV
jgi:hypothetical protein